MAERRAEPERLYWDACVFLSAVSATPDRLPTIQAILDDCDRQQVAIYTSMLSITEVAFGGAEKDGKALDPAIETRSTDCGYPRLRSSSWKCISTSPSMPRPSCAKSFLVAGASNQPTPFTWRLRSECGSLNFGSSD